jgi:hypothetical protein
VASEKLPKSVSCTLRRTSAGSAGAGAAGGEGVEARGSAREPNKAGGGA